MGQMLHELSFLVGCKSCIVGKQYFVDKTLLTLVLERRQEMLKSLSLVRVCRYTPSLGPLNAYWSNMEKMLNRVGVSAHPCFIPMLTGKAYELCMPTWKDIVISKSLGNSLTSAGA